VTGLLLHFHNLVDLYFLAIMMIMDRLSSPLYWWLTASERMPQRRILEQRLATLLQQNEPLDEYQQDEVVSTMAELQAYHDRI